MQSRRPVKLLDAGELLNYALKTLSSRALSLSEMRQRLLTRASQPDDVPDVLAQLKEYGYLDDKKFAETFAGSRLENRGQGKMRVLQDLRIRRVAPKLAEQVVTHLYGDKPEPELVKAYLERKYRNVNLAEYLADEKHMASAYRRLRTAGFSHAASFGVLRQHSKEAAQLEEITEETEREE